MPTSVINTEFAQALRNGQSYPPRTFRQWVESELVIPDGPHKNEHFRIERQPAIGLWIDQVDNPQWQDMVFTAVTQFGKSLFGFVSPLLYHACELGQSIGFCVPFSDMADNKWQADIKPVMLASPNLRRLLPTRGSGSSGGTVRDSVQLANGAILKIMSAGSDDSGKAGFTTPTLAITEAAKFSQAGGASVEADPLRQVRGRQRSYKREQRRTYIEGTLTVETELPWTLHEASTRSVITSLCVHCRAPIAPDREHLVGWRDARSELAAAKAATWICPECQKPITESQRHKMLTDAVLVHAGQKLDRKGKVTGKAPESTRLWYHATPFANCLLGPADIATDEYLAAQIPEDSPERHNAEKELCQFVWSRVYTKPKEEGQIDISRDGIANRRIEIGRGQLPDDVQLLATAYDLGDRTGWYLSLAARADGRLFVPDYGSFDIPSDQARPAEAIYSALKDQLPYLRAGYSTVGGGALRAHQVWADAGHEEKAIWRFVRDAEVNQKQSVKQWIFASRGRGESQMDGRKYTCPTRRGGSTVQIATDRTWYLQWMQTPLVYEVHWDADKYKWLAQHGMTLAIDRPGAIALFAGPEKVHRTLARHCCNEQLIHEFVPGKGPRKKWYRSGANHLLDCLAQAYAALSRLGYQPPAVKFDQSPGDVTASDSKSSTEAVADAKAKAIDEIAKRAVALGKSLATDPQKDRVKSWFSKY